MRVVWERAFTPDGILLEEPSASAIRALRSVCYFAYKLEQPFDDAVVTSKLDSFIEIDHELPRPDQDESWLSTEARAAVDAARTLIGRVFDCSSSSPTGEVFDPSDIVPRHGPGAVADNVLQHKKFRWRTFYTGLNDAYAYDKYMYAGPMHFCDRLQYFLGLPEKESGQAKVCLVPKDSRGPRLISMEPLEFQWIQQGLGRKVVDWLQTHPLTAGFVNFSDQSINRTLALESSVSGRFDTLDMKDASDRVSLWLVRRLFPPRIVRYLEATRSASTVLPDGRCVRLNKFAPMGSALCFPVESLVFWALAVAILDKKYAYCAKRSLEQQVYVFGDDLVVPHEGLGSLAPIFEELSLKFNDDKCCTDKFFRESCGMDAFYGEDVTPVRIKYWGKSPRQLLALCSYANAYRARGWHLVSEYIYSGVESQIGPLPAAVPGDLLLSRHCDSQLEAGIRNLKRRVRLNADTQQFEFESIQPRACKYKAGWSGWEELLRCSKRGSSDEDYSRRFDPLSALIEPIEQCVYSRPRHVVLTRSWTRLGV